MQFDQFVEKIEKLHNKYEQLNNDIICIEILQCGGSRIRIGDFDKRNKYIVYDMDIYKELEGTYTSIQEFDKKVKLFKKEKKIDKDIYMCTDEATISIGRGFRKEIGKLRITN